MAVPGGASLERFINRKRLFVRVQANVPRELFVQKLNTAFPGARIGVGNANAERGPVTQRVADINYDSAAEATQALRRNRFKLKVGNYDADITYQIERKDVVEKLAGEWGCRFMVVVKNLPPGEISCAELNDMFETAGEIFTIKILPGNRGEPYALVQYVEEQSVDMSIQQINQQKLHGAVLYVERHLKARRQGSSGNGQPAAPQPPPMPPASSPSPSSQTSQPQQSNSSQSSSTGSTARAATAAAAVASGAAAGTAASPAPATHSVRTAAVVAQTSQQQQQQAHLVQMQSAQTAAVSPQAQPAGPQVQQQQQPVVPQVLTQASLPSPLLSPTGSAAAAHSNQLGNSHPSAAPATPPSQPSKPALDTTNNSLFSTQYIPSISKQDSAGGGLIPQFLNGGTPPAPQPDSRHSIFGDVSLATGNGLGMAGLGTSPSSLMGPAAAVGGPSLRNVATGPAASMSAMGQSAGLGTPGSVGGTASHQVLTPMLDLFSHLREPAGPQSAGGALASGSLMPGHNDGMSNGGCAANGNGMHGGSTGASSGGMGGYAGMLLRSSPGAPTTSAPCTLLSPSAGGANGVLGLASASSIGSQPGGPAGVPGMLSTAPSMGGHMPSGAGQSTTSQPLPLMTHMSGQGLQVPHPLTSPAAQQQQQQHNAAVAAAAAANLGLARISIRDSLRLALGRLEEMVTCPITGEIMHDPVVAADGYSYERSAIQAWMSAHNVSPLSGEVLQHKMLTLNRLAKDIIADILP